MDELDDLIDQAVGTDAAPAAAEGVVGDDVAAATATSEGPASPLAPTATEAPASQETPSSDRPPDQGAAPPAAETPSTPEPEQQPSTATIDPETFAQLLESQRLTQAQLTAFIQADEARAHAERMAQLEAQWAQMDPVARAEAQAAFVAEQYSQQVAAAEQKLAAYERKAAFEEEQRREAEAKPKAIQKILEHFGLPKEEKALLEALPDPGLMVQVAQRRAQQLASVVSERREQVAANPALATGAAGTGASSRPAPPEFTDLDHLLDYTLGAPAAS